MEPAEQSDINDMKYLFLFLVICSCNGEVTNTLAYPKNFKVRFNHHVYGSRIMLPVTFGAEERKYNLQFDNHSPSFSDFHNSEWDPINAELHFS